MLQVFFTYGSPGGLLLAPESILGVKRTRVGKENNRLVSPIHGSTSNASYTTLSRVR
jgi:hypothetical protein